MLSNVTKKIYLCQVSIPGYTNQGVKQASADPEGVGPASADPEDVSSASSEPEDEGPTSSNSKKGHKLHLA
jgi:hypothetical protein